MTRFVIRHAKADPSSPTGMDDDRPLTTKGNAQAAYLARALSEMDNRPRRIISSPILRAHQTAQHIAEALHIEIEFEHALSTHAYTNEAIDFIDDIRDQSPVAFVGHNPTFSIYVAQLTDSLLSLKTGMCAVLECPENTTHAVIHDIIRMPTDKHA